MTTRHLGATYMEYSVFTSDWDEQHGFLQSGSNYMETSLKPSLCSAQDLGATGNMDIREKNLQIISFEQIRRINYINRCQQLLWPDIVCFIIRQFFGNDKPVSFTSSSRLNIRWVFEDQNYLTRRLGRRLKWIILHNIFLWETNIIRLSMKLAYLTRIF